MKSRPKKAAPPGMQVINLEAGMPTVPQALSRLADALRSAGHRPGSALKIIHGWGSTGVGGALRLAVQRELAQAAARGELRAFIAGEDWRISNQDAWDLLQQHPQLKQDSDLGRGNKGISIAWI